MGLCDVNAHPGPPLTGEWLAELIKHKGVAPYGGVGIEGLRASGVDHCESSKWIRWMGSHKALQLFGNSRLQISRRKIWRPALHWGPKEVSRWDEPIQTPLVCWHCPLRPPTPILACHIPLLCAHPFSSSLQFRTSSPSSPNQCHSLLL